MKFHWNCSTAYPLESETCQNEVYMKYHNVHTWNTPHGIPHLKCPTWNIPDREYSTWNTPHGIPTWNTHMGYPHLEYLTRNTPHGIPNMEYPMMPIPQCLMQMGRGMIYRPRSTVDCLGRRYCSVGASDSTWSLPTSPLRPGGMICGRRSCSGCSPWNRRWSSLWTATGRFHCSRWRSDIETRQT